MTFKGKDQFISLQGDTVNVSRGPAAAMVAIKQIGYKRRRIFWSKFCASFREPELLHQYCRECMYCINTHCACVCFGFYFKKKKIIVGDFWRDDYWLFIVCCAFCLL